MNERVLRELAREILGEGARLRQITGEGQRERRGIVHVAAPAKRKRLAGALPGGGGIPVEGFPYRAARFEQAGAFTSTRPLRDLDGALGHPSRVLQLPGASQGERLDMRDDVLGGGAFPGQRHNLFELVVGVPQEGNEILEQEKLGRIQPELRRPPNRQRRIIQAIQMELISGLADMCRCRAGRLQRDGFVGLGDRQRMLAGAGQGEAREQ